MATLTSHRGPDDDLDDHGLSDTVYRAPDDLAGLSA